MRVTQVSSHFILKIKLWPRHNRVDAVSLKTFEDTSVAEPESRPFWLDLSAVPRVDKLASFLKIEFNRLLSNIF